MTTQEARDILGLGNAYNEADVKTAFRQLSKRCHPDVGGTAGLFRIIMDAQNTLTRTTQQPPHPGQAATEAPRQPLWNPFRDPNYTCPWNDFMRIVLGEVVPLRCRGEVFPVTRSMLEKNWLHTAAPVTIEIRLWKNWFTKLLCKPEKVVKQEATFKNNSFGSFFFDLKLDFSVTPWVTNFYETRVEAPWAYQPLLFTSSGSCRTACNALPKVQKHSLRGLTFELTTKFTAK